MWPNNVHYIWNSRTRIEKTIVINWKYNYNIFFVFTRVKIGKKIFQKMKLEKKWQKWNIKRIFRVSGVLSEAVEINTIYTLANDKKSKHETKILFFTFAISVKFHFFSIVWNIFLSVLFVRITEIPRVLVIFNDSYYSWKYVFKPFQYLFFHLIGEWSCSC